MIVICREVDRRSGTIRVYALQSEVTDELLFDLRMRLLVHPELRYFVARRDFWEDPDMRSDIEKCLMGEKVSASTVKERFGMFDLSPMKEA